MNDADQPMPKCSFDILQIMKEKADSGQPVVSFHEISEELDRRRWFFPYYWIRSHYRYWRYRSHWFLDRKLEELDAEQKH